MFCESQTCGEPLSVPPQPRLLEGEAPRGLGEAVMRLIEARGYRVDPVPGAEVLGGGERPAGLRCQAGPHPGRHG